MRWLSAAARELLSLFVDDVPFTLAIVAWIAVGTLALPRLAIGAGWNAPLLFLGFAVILLVSVTSAARGRN
ncbi:MAG: hypothetical protein ACE5H8_12590 [Alphaproteobacteria bacterium]